MTREIRFRGRRPSTGEWVYGFLSEPDAVNVEVRDDSVGYSGYDDVIIDRATVGQYTGLKDKAGKEIFEGDLVCKPGKEKFVHEVIYMTDRARFLLRSVNGSLPRLMALTNETNRIVIGNKFQNPELCR